MKLICLLPFLLLACSSTRELRSEDASAASEGLAFLRTLAGTWAPLEDGQPAAQPSHVFRVTAGGSAVEETVFPGTEHEMVTLYFVQKGRLQLTHYCMKGNQPHMLAEPRAGVEGLAFACDGTGVASEAEGHMHSARLHLSPEGRLVSRWQFVENGQETELAAFELVRRP